MMDETRFVTIMEAVEAALDEWSAQGVPLADMEALVDDLVQKALAEWRDTPADKLPLVVPASDAGTISGAVLNAMGDWHSGGNTDIDEMETMAEDFAFSAIDDWKSGREAQAAPSPI